MDRKISILQNLQQLEEKLRKDIREDEYFGDSYTGDGRTAPMECPHADDKTNCPARSRGECSCEI